MSAKTMIAVAVVVAAAAAGGAFYYMSKSGETGGEVATDAAAATDSGYGVDAETAAIEDETVVDAFAVEGEEVEAGDEAIDESLGEFVEGEAEAGAGPNEEFVDVYEAAGEAYAADGAPADDLADDVSAEGEPQE